MPGVIDTLIDAPQGKSKPNRAPFLGAVRRKHGNSHIITMHCRPYPKQFLHQRGCGLQGPLANRIAQLCLLEISAAAEYRHSPIMEMRENVQDVLGVSRYF